MTFGSAFGFSLALLLAGCAASSSEDPKQDTSRVLTPIDVVGRLPAETSATAATQVDLFLFNGAEKYVDIVVYADDIELATGDLGYNHVGNPSFMLTLDTGLAKAHTVRVVANDGTIEGTTEVDASTSRAVGITYRPSGIEFSPISR